MTPRDDEQTRSSQSAESRTGPGWRAVSSVAVAAGIGLLLLTRYARTWPSFADFVRVCPKPFCDFVDYYYPTGETVFRTGLPVEGFLYSPFVAVLLAALPALGLGASLVIWGILQALAASFYVLVFRRLVPARLPVQLLFAALFLSSYPPLLNLMGGSVSVFTTAAILGVLIANERGQRAAAAGLLAFAASFKFYPVIFVLPFAARRDARFVLVAATACGALLLAVPGVLLGPGDTLRFYGALLDAFRHSDWVVTNPQSQFFPHVVLRLLDPAGPGGSPHLPLLRWISYGVALANAGLVCLVQRARMRHADLWSFQLLFLTVPFILKTSWPADFLFLSFTQAFLLWLIFEGESTAPGAGPARAGSRSRSGESGHRACTTVTCCALLVSIVLSSDAFYCLVGGRSYGFYGASFWADFVLLLASYWLLLPPALRQLPGTDREDGRPAPENPRVKTEE